MNEPPNQSLQWITASRRPLSFIVRLSLQCPLIGLAGFGGHLLICAIMRMEVSYDEQEAV